MSENRLNIISVATKEYVSTPVYSARTLDNAKSKELQAKFERLWLIDPERFNPLRNCMERERLERTWELLTKHIDPKDKQAADIGCGMGIFSERLQKGGAAQVTAVDIAENALKIIKEKNHPNIHPQCAAMPNTTLPEKSYDIIICTELIAEIPREDYRLFFAELARLIQPNGYLLCSSAIDIDSDGGIEKLIELAQTEFDLIEHVKSYHALYIRLKRLLEAPQSFTEGWANSDFRRKELEKRKGWNWGWYWLNSSPLFVWLWYAVNPLTKPLLSLFKNKRSLLLRLEKMSRFIWDEEGVSHYLFIAKRRALQTIDPRDIPITKPGKKEIWD